VYFCCADEIMKRLIVGIFVLCTIQAFAQEEIGIRIIGHTGLYRIGVYKGDTICVLDPAYCFPNNAKTQKEIQRYWKLVYNVKRVYPLAKIARERLTKVNTDLARMPSSKARKQYVEKAEKDLFRDFEPDIRKMTFTQGKILIKLIDRETGNTSYELVKEYKGTFTAFFWQGVARIFGSNLKSEYDPARDDRVIEEIIKRIDKGQI